MFTSWREKGKRDENDSRASDRHRGRTQRSNLIIIDIPGKRARERESTREQ